jgi:CRP-like cAMP-binding protein
MTASFFVNNQYMEKIFTTHQQIKDALYRIDTLDQRQREAVFEALAKELDDGGVTREELIRVVGELRNKGLISEIDKENIIKLIP